eukprot:3915213-Prymnesium_polylepis.1
MLGSVGQHPSDLVANMIMTMGAFSYAAYNVAFKHAASHSGSVHAKRAPMLLAFAIRLAIGSVTFGGAWLIGIGKSPFSGMGSLGWLLVTADVLMMVIYYICQVLATRCIEAIRVNMVVTFDTVLGPLLSNIVFHEPVPAPVVTV